MHMWKWIQLICSLDSASFWSAKMRLMKIWDVCIFPIFAFSEESSPFLIWTGKAEELQMDKHKLFHSSFHSWGQDFAPMLRSHSSSFWWHHWWRNVLLDCCCCVLLLLESGSWARGLLHRESASCTYTHRGLLDLRSVFRVGYDKKKSIQSVKTVFLLHSHIHLKFAINCN